jgi:preprotein translocase subunit SecG
MVKQCNGISIFSFLRSLTALEVVAFLMICMVLSVLGAPTNQPTVTDISSTTTTIETHTTETGSQSTGCVVGHYE